MASEIDLLEKVRRFSRACGFEGPVTQRDVDDVRRAFKSPQAQRQHPGSSASLTVAQAALELAVSERHIINLIESGRLRAFNVAVDPLSTRATVRITRESIELFKKGGY